MHAVDGGNLAPLYSFISNPLAPLFDLALEAPLLIIEAEAGT